MRVQSIKSCLIISATLCFISVLLIGFASLTPGWRSIKGQIRLVHNRSIWSFTVSTGLFGFLCSEPERTAQFDNLCLDWANNVSLSERIVSALCVIGALVGLIAFFWSLVILFDLFSAWENKPRLALPFLAFLTFILPTIAAVIYFFCGCSENDNFVAHLSASPSLSSSSSLNNKCSLHYSFFLSLVACVVAFLSFISALMVMLLKKRLELGTNSYY